MCVTSYELHQQNREKEGDIFLLDIASQLNWPKRSAYAALGHCCQNVVATKIIASYNRVPPHSSPPSYNTNLHAHVNWGHRFDQGLCGTCIRLHLFAVCTVCEYVCNVGDVVKLPAPYIMLRDFPPFI